MAHPLREEIASLTEEILKPAPRRLLQDGDECFLVELSTAHKHRKGATHPSERLTLGELRERFRAKGIPFHVPGEITGTASGDQAESPEHR